MRLSYIWRNQHKYSTYHGQELFDRGGNWGISHVANLPYIGQEIGDGWIVDEVTEMFGIIDVVLRRE